jgi:uncharacterized protein YkwD
MPRLPEGLVAGSVPITTAASGVLVVAAATLFVPMIPARFRAETVISPSPGDARQDTPRQERGSREAPQTAGIDLDALVEAHNRERTEAKRPPLRANAKLTAAARDHARDMAEHQKLSHEGGDGSDPSKRVKRRGYQYQEIAENVANGQTSVGEVMRTWMDSPGHRKNILGDFTEMGAAVVEDAQGRFYWCVDLGRPWPKLDRTKAPAALIAALNRARTTAKKSPVKEDRDLTAVASRFARDLAERRKVETKNRDGQTPFQILKREGYRARQFGLSLASGESDPDQVVRSWLERKEERGDLLSKFDRIGVGVDADEDGIPYWVALMAQTSPGS